MTSPKMKFFKKRGTNVNGMQKTVSRRSDMERFSRNTLVTDLIFLFWMTVTITRMLPTTDSRKMIAYMGIWNSRLRSRPGAVKLPILLLKFPSSKLAALTDSSTGSSVYPKVVGDFVENREATSVKLMALDVGDTLALLARSLLVVISDFSGQTSLVFCILVAATKTAVVAIGRISKTPTQLVGSLGKATVSCYFLVCQAPFYKGVTR